MSFESSMVQTLTVHNLVPGVVDPDGFSDELPTYDDGRATTGWVAPAAVTEDQANRETRLSDFYVYLRPDEDVEATSRIDWDGRTHAIIGRPRVFFTRRGAHHIELLMRSIEA